MAGRFKPASCTIGDIMEMAERKKEQLWRSIEDAHDMAIACQHRRE